MPTRSVSFASRPHSSRPSVCLFFFNDTATTEIYTLSLHDALPICSSARPSRPPALPAPPPVLLAPAAADRKSTRLNYSHTINSYAVFCLKNTQTNDHEHATTEHYVLLPPGKDQVVRD